MTGAGPTDSTDPSDPFGETRRQPGAAPTPPPASSDDAPSDQTVPSQSPWAPPGQTPPPQNPPTRSFEPIEGQQYQYSVPIPPADDYYGTQPGYGSPQGQYPQDPYQQGQDPSAYGYPADGGPDGPKRRTGRWIGLGLLAAVALIVIIAAVLYATKGSSNSSSAASSAPNTWAVPTGTSATTTSSAPSSTPSGDVVVTYEVTGGPLLVTYIGRGGLQTVGTPPSPWSVTVPLNNGFASVTAISKGSPVTCTIKRGDTVLSTRTSSAIAFCTATGVS